MRTDGRAAPHLHAAGACALVPPCVQAPGASMGVWRLFVLLLLSSPGFRLGQCAGRGSARGVWEGSTLLSWVCAGSRQVGAGAHEGH